MGSSDYCKWKWEDREREAYANVECKGGKVIFDSIHIGFIYCPYCRRRIEIIK